MLENFGIPGILELTSLKEYNQFLDTSGMGFFELNMNFPYFTSEKVTKLFHSQEDISKIYSIHLPDNLDIAEFNPEIREGNLNLIKNLLHAIPYGSVKILNLHLQLGNCFTLPNKVCFFYELYEKEYLQNIVDSVKILEPLLLDNKVTLCFENTGICQFSFIQKALEQIVQFQCCGLTWDIGHDAKSHYSDSHYFYNTHQNQIKHMHIHDFDGALDHKELFTGNIDLVQIFKFIQKHHICGVIETKNLQTLNTSIEKIKTLSF
ncbi:MAG: TIM barrel protein [Fusobacteria bacterium]|nr:TIM barrel protein [Fusobacteriota bacterium]